VSQKVHIADLEALERLRSSLVLFLERVHGVLDEVGEEVKRTRAWIQSEQPLRLGHELKRRQRELELLEQEHFTARLSNLREAKSGLQLRVNKKRREIAAVEEALRRAARWSRDYDTVVGLSARKVEKLRGLLDIEGARGVRNLGESLRLLAEYASQLPSPGGGGGAPSVAPGRSESAGLHETEEEGLRSEIESNPK